MSFTFIFLSPGTGIAELQVPFNCNNRIWQRRPRRSEDQLPHTANLPQLQCKIDPRFFIRHRICICWVSCSGAGAGCRLSGPFNVGIPRLMTRFREIPSLFHSSATQQISFSIMAIITFTLLTFFYLHTPFLFTTLCIFQYLFCIQISKTQFKSLCIYFPGEDIYFTSGVQSIIIIYYIIYLWH